MLEIELADVKNEGTSKMTEGQYACSNKIGGEKYANEMNKPNLISNEENGKLLEKVERPGSLNDGTSKGTVLV